MSAELDVMAKALAGRRFTGDLWEYLPSYVRTSLREDARAALQAIRSATPGMLNAGMTKADHTLAAEWTAMVDHILGEEPNA